MLGILFHNDSESNERVVLRLHKQLAPYKFAIFPLLKREPMMQKAEELYASLSRVISADFDTGASIGQLYRRHDEIGTPYCVTVDHQTMEDNTVTVRDRDSMKQWRVSVDTLLRDCHAMIHDTKWHAESAFEVQQAQ